MDRYFHCYIGYASTSVHMIGHNLYHISMTLDDSGIRIETRILQLNTNAKKINIYVL